MNITVIAVGKLREKPYRMMADEYLKRLGRFGKIREIELDDLPEPANSSPAIERQIKDREGEAILKQLKPGDYVIALTIPGRMRSSPELAQRLEKLTGGGVSQIVFVIGGSCGLSSDVLKRANETLSFGPITLPHNLARVVLLEQLYRACKISRGEPYHK